MDGQSPASERAALLAGLNPAQREAVTLTEGAVLVLAGAGSGKTRVIAHRIAYLIAEGVDPRRILAVTFTNRAAGEMAERVDALLAGRPGRIPQVGTFHATCVRILRTDAHHLGYPRSFVIYDETDRLGLVRDLCRELGLDERLVAPAAIVARLSHAKNRFRDPGDLAEAARRPHERQVAQVYAAYEARLRLAGALDFDDLLLLTVRLFECHPDVLARYRERWRYILVDEYQDTNAVQYRLLRLLTAAHGNLFVVGDPDQSIYRFRGAELRNILDFERDFPGTRVVRLEQNYRSTGQILDIAAAVIAHNPTRPDKTLWTDNARGPAARLFQARDETEEAAWVARTVAGLRAEGTPLDAIAVLYRTNAQSRVLEDACRALGLPYRLVGGVRFYERKEIKDALAYLRLAVNPADDVAFRRAIGAPPRGIGPTTLGKLEAAATSGGQSLLQASEAPEAAGIGGRPGAALAAFAALGRRLASLATTAEPLASRLGAVLDAASLREVLRREGTQDAAGRLENLDELCVAAEQFAARAEEGGLAAFLDSIALLSDVDELAEPRAAVTLMTLHAAKGLEFPVVFLAGLEEGVCPHARALDEPEGVEEERRLVYVGLTRAKAQLYLSYATTRRQGGLAGQREPSRFLLEMPPDALVPVGGSRVGPRPPASAWPDTMDEYPLRVGASVRHALWGEGRLIGIERDGADWVVTVSFAAAGRRRLALRHAPLEEI